MIMIIKKRIMTTLKKWHASLLSYFISLFLSIVLKDNHLPNKQRRSNLISTFLIITKKKIIDFQKTFGHGKVEQGHLMGRALIEKMTAE